MMGLGVSFVLIHVVFWWLHQNETSLFRWLTQEDGAFEYAQAVFYALAGVIFIVNSRKCERKATQRWMWLIAAGMLFIAGEEISWGQRIFDYSVESVESMSLQNEFNVHNLDLPGPLSPPRIQSMITLLFFVLLPIMLLWGPLHKLLVKTFAFPVPHPVLILCFASSYIWYSSFHPTSPFPISVEESRETTIALGFLTYAILAGHNSISAEPAREV